MNQVANRITTEDRSKASAVSLSSNGASSFLKVESLGDVVRFAEMMCQSKAGIPSYLHGAAADCMAITMQALQWGMNPFSVAQKSYKIKDVIAYEAQLIAAVINTRADLKRRPQISFEHEGDHRQCTVVFEFNDGSVQIYVSPPVSKITPKNSPLWKTDPDQQLSYYSIRAGGRRYCPEVILGVYDRDEVEEFRGPDGARDITPKPSVMERLRASANSAPSEPASEREGFSASSVQQQTDRVLTGDIVGDEPHDPVTGELTEQPSSEVLSPDASESDSADPVPPGAVTEPADDPAPSAGSTNSEPTLFGKFEFSHGEVAYLKELAVKALDDAASDNDPPAKEAAIERLYLNYAEVIESQGGREAMSAMGKSIAAVVNGKRTRSQAADYIARDIIGVKPEELEGRRNV